MTMMSLVYVLEEKHTSSKYWGVLTTDMDKYYYLFSKNFPNAIPLAVTYLLFCTALMMSHQMSKMRRLELFSMV